jgi:diacylglycerol kinase (ATP)
VRIKVLLNPYSNRWNARARWPEAEAALKAAGLQYDLSISERPDHLVELAEQAVGAGFDTLVVAGGDGSLGEAVNGAARAWQPAQAFPVRLGILPLGSANDLADTLRLPRDLKSAAALIAAGNTRPMDLGRCNDRYFLNNSAAGLEPYVTVRQEKIGWIKGVPRYLVAALQGVMARPEWGAEIDWDGGSYRGPLSLISIGNGPRSGGIFFMAPHADPFDGKLTFAYGYRRGRLALLQALPRAMKPGRGSFVEMEGMHEAECTRLRIHLDRPSPVHTDGELFPKWERDLEYGIVPAAVPVLMG